MKNFFILIFLFYLSISFAQVGIETTTPNGILDVNSSTSGIVAPTVALTSLNVASPVVNPQGGALKNNTLVYHNGTNGIDSGYYYWETNKWIKLMNSAPTTGLQYFVFSGTGVSPGNNKPDLSNLTASGLCTSLLNDSTQNALVTGDNFTIKLTGYYYVSTTGDFKLQSYTDDGARVYVDDVLILNRWIDQGATVFDGVTVKLAKGYHKFEFWYYENTGTDQMEFRWLTNANGHTGVINASDFFISY